MFKPESNLTEKKKVYLEIKKGEPSLETINNIFGSKEVFWEKIKESLKAGDYKIGTNSFTRQVLGPYWSKKEKIGDDFIRFKKIISRIAKEIVKDQEEAEKDIKNKIDEHTREEKKTPAEESRELWQEESERTGNPDEEEFLKNN